MEIPAGHERLACGRLRESEYLGLLVHRRHPCVHGEAGHGAGILERPCECLANKLRIADLDGVERPARQHGHEGRDPRREFWHVG